VEALEDQRKSLKRKVQDMSLVVSYEVRMAAAVIPVVPASGRNRLTTRLEMPAMAVKPVDALGELLAIALQRCRPTSVAMLRGVDDRLDLSLGSWDTGRRRYATKFSMDLRSADLCDEVVSFEPMKMVHAELVLEQAAEVGRCLDHLVSLVDSDGFLSIVLKSPGQTQATAGRPAAFVSPIWLMEALVKRGFSLVQDRRRSVSPGEGYWLGVFKRGA